MMREVLFDTNMLISAYDHDETREVGSAVDGSETRNVDFQRRKCVEKLASDPEVRLWITPLIYYEVLRGVVHKSPAEMENELRAYQRLEIREAHGHRAAELYRLAKDKDEWLDKRRFDIFHCVCAEIDGLEFVHDDRGDIPTIQKLITATRRQ
jgi:predicted nucleic acid-binding protein